MRNGMSALPPKADMCGALAYVRFVPIADINRCLPHLGFFSLGDGRISLQVGTPSGSYVRVMKDGLATIYAKVLFFSTRPFKNEF